MAERVQKVLANAGVGSRRQIEGWIKQGRVIIDGKPAQLGDRLSGNEKISVDGRAIRLPGVKRRRNYFLAYHKPAGEITSRADPEGRATIFDDIRPPPHGRWITVGRLDVSTSGLLLLTTDGELAHRLMHPSYEISRTYAVRLLGELTTEQRVVLLDGVALDDGVAHFD
ncbi:MAG: 23S rRNA pseudouridylate synthase B, partial [Gammaproteobacteria bacterium]|nr:23S rRNA pseudouridylate synthase B [Gammaproteobacteria bacterium]